MRCAIRYSLAMFLCLAAASCGGDVKPPTQPSVPTAETPPTTPAPTPPTAPTAPTPTPNQAPQILGVTVTPSLGVTGVSIVTARVDARDPDGDPLSYAWVGASSPSAKRMDGPGTPVWSFTSGTVLSAVTVTVTDSKGAKASGTAEFATVEMARYFEGLLGDGTRATSFTLMLNRTGSTLTGTISISQLTGGTIDAAAPGQIDGAGQFRLPFKLLGGELMTLTGHLERSTRYGDMNAVGQASGGPLSGQPFTFHMHDPY